MRTVIADAAHPGPDGNLPQDRIMSAGFELRDAQAIGKPYRYLEGMAVPYRAWADIGWFLEQHDNGSFAHSTRGGTGKNLPLLLFHDNRSWPAGHAEKWTHEDDGMLGVWRLNDTPAAQTAATLADNGDLNGLSIGFAPIRSKWEFLDLDEWDPDLGPDHKDRVTRIESRLLEVSLTPTPAFVEAKITAVRERSRYSLEARRSLIGSGELDAWKRAVDKLRRPA